MIGDSESRFIRPEKLTLSATKQPNSFKAKILRIDYWGFQKLVKLTNENGDYFVYSDNNSLNVGDELYIVFNN